MEMEGEARGPRALENPLERSNLFATHFGVVIVIGDRGYVAMWLLLCSFVRDSI
jgi:hypothetical protein